MLLIIGYIGIIVVVGDTTHFLFRVLAWNIYWSVFYRMQKENKNEIYQLCKPRFAYLAISPCINTF